MQDINQIFSLTFFIEMRRLTRNAEESEKSIESYLRREVEAAGGRCLKYYNAMERGYPDRIVMMKGGILVWVEIKSRGRKPTVLQEARMTELRDLWQNVAVVSSRREVDELLGHFADESASTGHFGADRLEGRSGAGARGLAGAKALLLNRTAPRAEELDNSDNSDSSDSSDSDFSDDSANSDCDEI